MGTTVTLKCRVISDLHPYIFWVKHYHVNGSYEDDNGTAYFTEVQVPTTTLGSIRIRIRIRIRAGGKGRGVSGLRLMA